MKKQRFVFVKRILILYFILVLPAITEAKKRYLPELYNQPKSHLGIDLYYGYIVKHTKRIITPINESSQALELTYSRATFGKYFFERKFNYPEIGGTLFLARFGNNEYFGNVIGAFPHVTFWMKRSKLMDAYFRFGIGLAYISKSHDFYTNPLNNMIGSNVNNLTQLRWGINWKLSEVSQINTAFNITHFSNGHSQNPNLGINYLGLSLGYRLNLGVGKQVFNRDSVPKIEKKHFFIVGMGVGVLEKGRIAYGPTFNSYSLYFQYNRATGHTNHLITGVNIELNDMNYKEMMYRENNESDISNKTINSTNIALLLGDEILLQRIGFLMQVGIYVFRPYYQDNFSFQKIGVNYYFPDMGKSKMSLFAGVNVKLHLAVAESLEFRSGIRF